MTARHAVEARAHYVDQFHFGDHLFESLSDDSYQLYLKDPGVTMTLTRLYRDHEKLIGELRVEVDSTKITGARIIGLGSLITGSFTLNSVRSRTDWAKELTRRAQTRLGQMDWDVALELFHERVREAHREGHPAIDLRTAPKCQPLQEYQVLGLKLLRAHPCVLFGDGGSLKSYLALHIAGTLAKRGLSVGYFDWELSASEHRDRLEKLFPDEMPLIHYIPVDRPLVDVLDHLKREVVRLRLQWAVLDSVFGGCDGPPEDTQVTKRYLSALTRLRYQDQTLGTLLLAHISKGEGSDQKPFGSSYWHHWTRATWYIETVGPVRPNGCDLHISNRKANFGPRAGKVALRVAMAPERTVFERTAVISPVPLVDEADLSERMVAVLTRGPLPVATLADQLDADKGSIRQVLGRHPEMFVKLNGSSPMRVGLLKEHLHG